MKLEPIKTFHIDNMVVGEEVEKHPDCFSIEKKDTTTKVFSKPMNDDKKEIVLDKKE